VHTEVDMAAPDRPARIKPYANGLTRQCTEVMCPTAVDNLVRVECDSDLPPALHKRVGKGLWYAVEHEVPVLIFTTALESVGDKILSHHQSQLPVYREPACSAYDVAPSRAVGPSVSWGTTARLWTHHRRHHRHRSPRSRSSPSPSFERGRPGCTPHWRSAVYCVIGSEDAGLIITPASPSTSTPRPSRRRRRRRTRRRASALPSLWVLRPYLDVLVTAPPHWCGRTRGSSSCPRKCESSLLPTSSSLFRKTRLR